jgi:anti-sigma-K factor RskA
MVYTFGVVDVKEYISSGILESVILGFASDQERQEVSCMSHIYPEIQEEMSAIEISFEKMLFQSAIAPAAHLRAAILAAIANEPQIPAENEQKEAKIVQMQPSSGNPWKFVAAASIILTIGTTALWFTSYNQSNQLAGQLAEMEQKQNQNEQTMTAMKVEQERMSAIQSVVSDGSMKKIVMAGTQKDPGSSVSVMWSDNGKKAVMVAAAITPPPTDMQYQLWAIADGKPVSLGVFDYDEITKMTEPFEVNAKNEVVLHHLQCRI